MLVHRELIVIALIIMALSATNKVAASSSSSRHLRGPGVEPEDSLAADSVVVEKEEEERHLGATAPPGIPQDGATNAPTPTPIPAECNPACGDGEVCAREWPDAKAKCYNRCSGFPPKDACTGNEMCVFSTFNCGGYASVFNDFCECDKGSKSYLCRPSECGLAGPV
jgi:hypothetical protein